MVNQVDLSPESPQACKNVRTPAGNVQTLPATAVLEELLQPLELQLQRKSLVPSSSSGRFFPVWFLAETERNVFLWRSGYSLDDREQFEFWVDVQRLIDRRQHQLLEFTPDNPFLSPLWGVTHANEAASGEEEEYLQAFLYSFQQISAHANALSIVGSTLREESPLSGSQTKVLLPAFGMS